MGHSSDGLFDYIFYATISLETQRYLLYTLYMCRLLFYTLKNSLVILFLKVCTHEVE